MDETIHPAAFTMNSVVRLSFSSVLTILYIDLDPFLTIIWFGFRHKRNALSSQLNTLEGWMFNKFNFIKCEWTSLNQLRISFSVIEEQVCVKFLEQLLLLVENGNEEILRQCLPGSIINKRCFFFQFNNTSCCTLSNNWVFIIGKHSARKKKGPSN